MWIFGYGSLMYDGWENSFQCVTRKQGTLLGYERAFTKASTEKWGTTKYPAPTLQVIAHQGKRCDGVAFQFGPETEERVLEYLQDREGRNFHPRSVDLEFSDGTVVIAQCFFYEGKSVIGDNDFDKLATMAMLARGTSGSGVDYVVDTKRQLDDMGISDKIVDAYFSAVQRRSEP